MSVQTFHDHVARTTETLWEYGAAAARTLLAQRERDAPVLYRMDDAICVAVRLFQFDYEVTTDDPAARKDIVAAYVTGFLATLYREPLPEGASDGFDLGGAELASA